MNSSENTQVIKMKENYAMFLKEDESLMFGNTRHNLLPDFEETPVKSLRLMNNSANKRSFSTVMGEENSELSQQLSSQHTDIIRLKAHITKLEAHISHMEVSAQEARIQYDDQVTKLKMEKERDAAKAVELKSRLLYVMEREKNTKEEVKRLEEALHSQKQDLDQKIASLQKEKRDISDQNVKVKCAFEETEARLHNHILTQKKELSNLEAQLKEARAQLELQKKVQLENYELKQEVDIIRSSLEKAHNACKELEHQLSEHKDNLIITRALKQDLDMVPSMKNELEQLRLDNEQLRSNEQNCYRLEEEVLSLKKKIEYLLPLQERVTELEVETEVLQGRLQRWEVADTSGSRRPQSPCSLTRRIHELETNLASKTLAEGEIQASLNSTQRKLDQALAEINRLTSGLVAEKSSSSQSSDTLKHIRRKLLLVTKERDSYRTLLDSYENEVTVNFDAEKKAQIQTQVALLQGYQEHNSELEAENRRLTEKVEHLQADCLRLQQELAGASTLNQQVSNQDDKDAIMQLRMQVSDLEKTLADTQQEKDILEARIEQRNLQGDYDPSKTKVLHMIMNPCAVALQARAEELNKLREDNERLKKRNQILEENEGRVEDLTMQVQEKMQCPSPSKEVEEMKAQLQREEMRNKRLMEVFKKTSQELREAHYQLTGYKIDIPCTNQYKLTSMYAESSRDYFLFQQNAQGEIQMLQTDFSMSVQNAMELYLGQHNSIPMFLSHITMELFSRQTMNLG